MAGDPIVINPQLDALFGQNRDGSKPTRVLLNGGDDDLSELNTNDKSSIVAAINEILATGGNGSGTNGKTVLSGAGVPSNSLGTAGDFYINTTLWTIHGPKASGTWPAGVSLVGATGAKGDKGDTGSTGAQGADASPLASIDAKTANYTLVTGDSAKILNFTATSALTLTLPNSLPVGFQVAFVQNSTGAVSVSAASGASVTSRQGFTKTAGQNAIMSLVVIENVGGSAAKYLLTGDGVA